MTHDELQVFFNRRIEAWRRRDVETLVLAHAEDGVLESPIAGKVAGHSAIETVYRGFMSAFPDMNVESPELIIEGDRVVVAAGAWAPAILKPVGIALRVEPQRGQIVHLRLPGTDTSRWPVLLPLNSYYLLAFEDSRVVVGASREANSGFDYRLTAAGVAGVLNAGLAVAPGLASWTLHEIRIGFRPFALDNLPMLGNVPGTDDLFIGNGLGPSGLAMGPFSGAQIARLAMGKPSEIPLGPYAPMRRIL